VGRWVWLLGVGLKTPYQNEIHHVTTWCRGHRNKPSDSTKFRRNLHYTIDYIRQKWGFVPWSFTDYLKETRFEGVDVIQLTGDWSSCDICENGSETRLQKGSSIPR
jgi:hypothetical protein